MSQFTSSLVRIVSPTGKLAGNGLLVSRRRVLTSASVVAEALGIAQDAPDVTGRQIDVDFSSPMLGGNVKARVVFWQPALDAQAMRGQALEGQAAESRSAGADVAILELESDPPEEPEQTPPPSPTNMHYMNIVRAIVDGRVVPFLGAGASLFGRPAGEPFERGKYLPGGGELAVYLARNFGYPMADMQDLLRVSQYVSLVTGQGPLYLTLHELFDADYPITDLHRFFARVPGLLREKGYTPRHQLIVTTNYDDLLERAFREAGEPFDLVCYVADGNQRGKFLHWDPEGKMRVIDKPNEDHVLSVEKRTVILKIHGAIDRINPERDSYVITEDHYIDYLTRTEISNLIPVTLTAKMRMSHFLFLGYSLRDWNLRVILHRIWGQQELSFKSWAIQLNPQELDQIFWDDRGVDILNARLEDFILQLNARLRALPQAGGQR